MKLETKPWLARILFVALVAAGTLVVGPRVATAAGCVYPSAGTCPPLSDSDGSCYSACQAIGWRNGGDCVGSCCVCFE